MNEPSGVMRVPKGILKNSGRNSGGDHGGQPEGVQMGYNYMNMDQPHLVPHPAYAYHAGTVNPPMNIPLAHSHMYPPDYGNYPVPVHNLHPLPSQFYQVNPHASQWGINYENHASRSPDQPPSPEALYRQKLETFLRNKGTSLFRKLNSEETPLLESRLEERKSEGNYAVAPSIDFFLSLDPNERTKEFMKSVQVGDIVVAEVHSKSPNGLVLSLLCCDGGKRAFLEDLGIKGTCAMNQIVPLDPTNPNKSYEEEDFVRCEVLEVTYESRKVGLGMKGINLSQETKHAFPLGLVSHDDLPVQYVLTRSEIKSRRRRSYEDILDASAGFHNPNSIVCLGTSLGVFSSNHSLMAGLSGSFLKKDMANELRNAQNAKWAQYNVTLGIRHFKQGNQVEAFQCLNKAIIIDSQNVEGLVARGALYANNGSFEKAMEDFEAALKSNPDHFNGRKYMAETLVVVGKGQQESGKMEEALNSYAKCLAMLPEHKDSILSLMTLHTQIENLSITHLSPTSSAPGKLLQVKEKLRSMIAAEIAKKKLGYYEKMEKNNGKGDSKKGSTESESSSSSSSDSESSSSADDDDSFRKGKKKKNKRRSKKKKKNKRNVKSSKETSLSPFSRKLHANEGVGSGLAGFSGTSYSEWGQQLGLVNKYAGHSDADSQRSSRKSREKKKSKKSKEKRKKKRRGSTSSDSESPSQSKDSRKRDKRNVITDFGEIEEQLTAYFSKCEQGKPEARIPPQAVKITVEQSVDNTYHRFYDAPSRRIEVVPEPTKDLSAPKNDNNYEFYRRASVSTPTKLDSIPSKIQLTDEFGNFQTQKIIRTVQNEPPEQTGRKFEMRFNVKSSGTSLLGSSALGDLSKENTNTGLPGSKWRTVGAAMEEPAYSDISKSEDVKVIQEVVRGKNTQAPHNSSALPISSLESAFETSEKKTQHSASNVAQRDRDRSYSPSSRKRSRSVSRSRSRSRSRSVSPRWRREKYESANRRRSHSRSRSRSRTRRSLSRGRIRGRFRSGSRSRTPSPGRRRSGKEYVSPNYQGRYPVRFFRGFHPAARRGTSRFHPQAPGGRGGGPSKFRNRFNRSRSRSRSRSPSFGRRSVSRSPIRIRRSRSPSYEAKLHGPVPPRGRRPPSVHTPHRQTDAKTGTLEKSKIESGKESSGVIGEKSGCGNQKSLNKEGEYENTEMNVCGMKTKKIADVEELLDKHKAHKKEEMRENNPDFFRNP